jgi:hypothetical protein
MIDTICDVLKTDYEHNWTSTRACSSPAGKILLISVEMKNIYILRLDQLFHPICKELGFAAIKALNLNKETGLILI